MDIKNKFFGLFNIILLFGVSYCINVIDSSQNKPPNAVVNDNDNVVDGIPTERSMKHYVVFWFRLFG